MKRILILAVLLTGCARNAHDDTDPPDGMSGMDLFTDNATGCQYLGYGASSNGKALTPRIASDGKSHMGCREARQ
jgi:hypothetical protein